MLVSAILLLTLAGILVSARVVRELGALKQYERAARSDEDASAPVDAAPALTTALPTIDGPHNASPVTSVPSGNSQWASSTATATSTSLSPARHE